MRRALVLMLSAAALAAPAAAHAAFPGANGKIAFVSSGTTGEIFTMDPDGQNPLALTSNADWDLGPAYSADGEKIVFLQQLSSSGDHIWTMNVDGSDQVQLTTGDRIDGFNPSFFPDGRIAFASVPSPPGFFQIYAMNPDGSNQTQLTNVPGMHSESPSVSPDGRMIAFERFTSPGSAYDVFVMNADGSNQTPVAANPGDDMHPDWSPDGQRIVFERRIGTDREIVVMDANGQNQTILTDNAVNDSSPVFSPDGRKIAFTRRDGDNEIVVMDVDGQNQVPLAGTAVDDFEPDWQPLNPPAIDVTVGKQKSPKSVTATVVCQNENATVTLDGTLRAPKPKPKASASKKKTVELDAVTLQLQPGVPQIVQVPVAGKGKKLIKKSLKAGKKPKGTLTATATDDLGALQADSADVKYKKKK